MEQKQYLLLVDNNDIFSGEYEEKEKCHTGLGIHHRAFVVVISNKNNEVLLQKRKHKRWDGYWDVSAISHVLHLHDHDETYEEAAGRSLKIEMGITGVDLKKVGAFNYFAQEGTQCENEYCAILTGAYNEKVTPNNEVLYEYAWIGKDAFLMDVEKNPQKYTPWAIQTAKAL